ncbi:PAS domain S-box protein [Salinarchaeum chitinilyticum]
MRQPIRVLLVDDEPDYPETAANYLERENDRLEVTPASNAEAGLDHLAEATFDCVVSDYAMPGMDGLAFLEAVREEYPELPFVLFTARGSEDVASEAITAGVSDYYQRARHGDDEYAVLANRITNLADRYRAEREAERSRSHLRAIAENSADAIVTVDADSTIRFANAAVRELFGYDPDELLGEPLSTLVPERHQDGHRDALDRYLETGERRRDWSDVEFTGRRADGTELPLSISFGEFDHDGERRFVGILRDLTQRKEEARRLETLISNLPGIVYRSRNEPGWPMDVVRGECEAITGYDPAAIESGGVVWGEDVIHPDDREGMWETVQQAIDRDEPFEVTYRIETANGETRWMWERGRIVTPHTGERVLEGFISDVTDRHERERELERVERRYDSIFNDPNILAALLDTDGTVLDVNERAVEFIDTAPSAALGSPLWTTDWIGRPNVPQSTVREWIDRAAAGSYVEFESEFTLPDGTTSSIEGVFRPVRDVDGSVQSIVVSARDVTERKRRQERLRQYELAIENASEMMVAIDDEFEYLFANRAYREYYGLDQETLRDTSLRDTLDEEAFETTRPYLERAFDGETTRYRTTRSRPDEPTRVLEAQFSPLVEEDGSVQGVVETMRDLTEQRERETQLVSLDRMLRHNLNNELNVVLGYAEMIEREGEGEIAEYATTITAATRRVLEQADKEREIVELLTDQSPPERIDLCETVSAMVDRLEERYPEADVAYDLPERLQIVAIPEIVRAIEELVTNAIVHSDRDEPTVSIGAHHHNGTVRISVRDDGPGMPPQERRVIGDDSPIDPLVHSSGMGLWLVKRIANRTGGTLRFEETESEGSEVTLVIPGGVAE